MDVPATQSQKGGSRSGGLLFRRGEKLCGDHFVKKKGKEQSERHAQEGIDDAEQDGLLDTVNTGTQHQCAEAIHRRFVAVIGAEAQAQSPQRTEQGMQRLRGELIEYKKQTGACNGAYDTLPEAEGSIMRVGILGEQGCTGKADPHEALHSPDLSRR